MVHFMLCVHRRGGFLTSQKSEEGPHWTLCLSCGKSKQVAGRCFQDDRVQSQPVVF